MSSLEQNLPGPRPCLWRLLIQGHHDNALPEAKWQETHYERGNSMEKGN